MMLANNLTNRPQFLGFAEVRTQPPHNFAVSSDNRQKAGLAAADDHVVRSEPLISFVEPVIRADVGRRVDMQPVETTPRAIRARRGLDGIPGSGAEAEFFDVVAGGPFPGDVAVR